MERVKKHNLVVSLLRRWNYCMEDWPGNAVAPLEKGYIESHTKGVRVGIDPGVFGQLKDDRPKTMGKVPSMESLLTLHTSVLQGLVIKGIEKQLQDAPEKLKEKLHRELEKVKDIKVNKTERYYQDALSRARKEGTAVGAGATAKPPVAAATPKANGGASTSTSTSTTTTTTPAPAQSSKKIESDDEDGDE